MAFIFPPSTHTRSVKENAHDLERGGGTLWRRLERPKSLPTRHIAVDSVLRSRSSSTRIHSIMCVCLHPRMHLKTHTHELRDNVYTSAQQTAVHRCARTPTRLFVATFHRLDHPIRPMEISNACCLMSYSSECDEKACGGMSANNWFENRNFRLSGIDGDCGGKFTSRRIDPVRMCA